MVICPVCREGTLIFDRVEERLAIKSPQFGNYKTVKEKIYKCNKQGCICELNEQDYDEAKKLQ